MANPALSLEPAFRSGLERRVAEQLDKADVAFLFEDDWVHYVVPERNAKYLPDFKFEGTNIIIEAKGRFGGAWRGSDKGAEERQKLILLKEQHPELEIRIVFERASTPIYKGSKTTYAKWADTHGFKWADKGTVPADWIKELQQSKTEKRK